VRVGEQMRRALDDFRFLWGDRAFSIHVSIGVVALGSESGELEQVLGAADEACYAAKDNGRNRVHVYHENDHDLARRRGGTQWLAPLEHALEADEFRLMYQPIVPTRPDDSDARRFELLLRLLGDDGQLVLPGAFLPAAERHGLATRIDRWVLEHALAWLEHEANRGRPVSMCALNLSARSLVDDAFKAFVIERLRGRESLASSLVFEVSETAAIANLAATAGFMHALGGLGCRFAIDDFGSGLSSFSYLKSLPVDYLKIDGVFVRDMASNPVDRAMVRAINEIGQVMGKRTVAEFTEDARTAELIRELGVDFSQGYWIGRPQPIEPADDE
jgi:EAL domain-containing protein (putative c-di-GMP-specific phosphodiesterase class I)